MVDHSFALKVSLAANIFFKHLLLDDRLEMLRKVSSQQHFFTTILVIRWQVLHDYCEVSHENCLGIELPDVLGLTLLQKEDVDRKDEYDSQVNEGDVFCKGVHCNVRLSEWLENKHVTVPKQIHLLASRWRTIVSPLP